MCFNHIAHHSGLQSAFFVLVDGPKILLFCFSVFLAAVAYAFLVLVHGPHNFINVIFQFLFIAVVFASLFLHFH